MAVSHVFSNAVADAAGTMTIWFGATTATVAASDVVKPSDWNSAHNQVVTLGGNTAGVSTISGTNIVFGGSNNITLSGIQGANAATINISAAAGGGGSVNVSAGTTSNNLTNFVFADSNGVSFGLNGSTVTATVATNYQSAGAYLTTARASNDAIGLATAQSNVTWTANSAGLSLDARGYAGTGTTIGATNLSASATLNSNGLQLSLSAAAGGGGADGGNTIIAGTRTAGSNSGVLFDNSNGVTFGLNAVGGTVLTASVRTDYASSAHAHTENVGTATAQTNVTWTVNSNGLSLNAAGYAGTGFTSTTTAGTAIVATNATNGLSLAFPTIVTNALSSQSNQNITAANGGFAFQTLSFSNLNGVSFGTSAGSAITASVQTSYRASNDAIGTNTAQSNVTWTANSAGLSLDARGYAGTGTTFNGANLSGSMTVNSNGVQLSMSAAAPGGGGLTQGTFYAQSNTTQSSSGTIALSSLNFAGAGIASVGITNGSVLISVPAGGGAGDGGVFAGVSNLGNTAGSTGTVSTGNFVLVGSNGISLSQSTGAAGSAATITINGPTLATLNHWANLPVLVSNDTGSVSIIQAHSSIIFPLTIPAYVSGEVFRPAFSFAQTSTQVATTANATGSFGASSTWRLHLYTQGTGASTSQMHSMFSTSVTGAVSCSYSENTTSQQTVTYGQTFFNYGGSATSSGTHAQSSASIVFAISVPNFLFGGAARLVDLPFSTLLSPGVYIAAINVSSASASGGTTVANMTSVLPRASILLQTQVNQAWGPLGLFPGNTHKQFPFYGTCSTAGSVTTGTIPLSVISSGGFFGVPFVQINVGGAI